MDDRIKQLLPIPEQLTPLLRVGRAEGKYTDTFTEAKAVFIALMDDIVFGSYTVFYVVDSDGNGEFAEEDEAQKAHGAITDEKARNVVALYAALLSMSQKAGGEADEAIKNAGYVTYAYLGGQAKREITYTQE